MHGVGWYTWPHLDTITSANDATLTDSNHNFKLVIDFNSSTFYLYMDGALKKSWQMAATDAGSAYEGGNYFRRSVMTNKTTGYRKVVQGIGGLAFMVQGGSAKVTFDNIKVYSDKAYNTYQTFDTLDNTKNVGTPGWYRLDTNANSASVDASFRTGGMIGSVIDTTNAMISAAGKDDTKGAKFTLGGNGPRLINHLFDVPVKAGKAFTVEFDIYDESAAGCGWCMGIATETDTQSTAKSAYVGLTASTGEAGAALNAFDSYMGTNIIGVNNSSNALAASQYRTNNYNKVIDSTYAKNVWQHIKVEVIPNSPDATKYTIKTKDDDKAEVAHEFAYFADTAVTTRGNFSTEDIYGLSFMAVSTWNTPVITLDNLKVYESEASEMAVVKNIDVIGYDGGKTASVNSMTSDKACIRIEFSSPLKNTDGINVFYPYSKVTENAVPVTKTLSSDKKTVDISFLSGARFDTTMVLAIDRKIEFENSGLTDVDETSYSFSLTEKEGEIAVTEFRMYKLLPDLTRSNNNINYVVKGGWYPVGNSITGVDSDDLKIIAKGYNSLENTDGIDFNILTAAYGGDYVLGVEKWAIVPERGLFSKEINSIGIPDGTDRFGGFMFDMNNLLPYSGKIEYIR